MDAAQRELSLFTPWGGRRWREFAGAGCGGPGSAAAWWPGTRIGLQGRCFRGMVGAGCP